MSNNKKSQQEKEQFEGKIFDNVVTAILIDGGFYRKRAHACFGDQAPEERANQLESYVKRHLNEKINGVDHEHTLYRIFYYDCPPIDKAIYDPVNKKNIEFNKTNTFKWTNEFFTELKKRRKFALRLGELSDAEQGYYLPPSKTKDLLSGKLKTEEIQLKDLNLMIKQKGVDMRIGVDIASLAYKKQVNQIILIAGDSDFVPAAKLARREGIDFVLDPLGAKIKENLFEHIDGLNVRDNSFKSKFKKTDKN